jgi:hypothetical protein
MSLDDEITALLNQSRAAHFAYRENTSHRTLAREAIQKARDLRAVAHQLDPAHQSAAWDSEPSNFNHEALLKFYDEQLNRI